MANQSSLLVALRFAEFAVEETKRLAERVENTEDASGLFFLWGMAIGIQTAANKVEQIAREV